MKIKLAIFDFDGTIADTRKAIIVAKQETMKKLGLRIASEEECASTIGLSSKSGFQKSYPELSDEMLDWCVVIYREFFEEKRLLYPPELFPGIIEVLEALNEKGIVCTIATSRNGKSCREFLEQLGIAKYFSYVLCAEDTTLLKPNPEPVLKTLADLKFAPEEALVIGDMPMDIQMAKGAGVFACGVTYGNATGEELLAAGADFTVDEIYGLKGILFEKA
ncbi:MAG: HAD family hydrolase [Lachnospiraceae bacterium]|nr:HAD family hydrolase [Lachnospiraceae bacterium]